MNNKYLKKLIRYLALKKGYFKGIYVRLCHPTNDEFAIFLKAHGGLHSIGENCRVNVHANITDPAYVSIGNNVTLSDCHLLGHEEIAYMLNTAYNMNIEVINKIVIKDNVFIGHDAIILPGITIADNSVVAARSLVNSDVPSGVIVGGVPAKVIGNTIDLAMRLQIETDKLPWSEVIKTRSGPYDPNVEDELISKRVKHFFPQ